MDTIKKGTHGVLTNTNSGVTIPGTLVRDWHPDETNYALKIDGDTTDWSNIFPVDAGWTFEADIQLPTEVGSVINIIGVKDSTSGVWLLGKNEVWISTARVTLGPEVMASHIKDMGGKFEVVR